MISDILLESVITCPVCGHQQQEIMPVDACVFFYECENCKTILKPTERECCVFCSFGSVPCPPQQHHKSCCM
ncbi:MAG: GDCCVxC domain-containing (seleno)protein [Bacteroidota bacterium]|nr:GDCCVxC domain-containing (seleno)protein [Saprospiraceae bacterium]MDZ4807985.1 GDCCVxC domain-containing (seleno)protein [Bacteroidota bacterium]